ncbi:MAG: hypothetical protein RIB63_08520, partial [Fulvivirga sp.]
GAGSQNVMLVKSKAHCDRLIKRAFGRGFATYNSRRELREAARKFFIGKAKVLDVAKAFIRLFIPPSYAKINGNEKGYAYFQEYYANNTHDIRIIVIGRRAFALKRFVRENDFRASGSGLFSYSKGDFDEEYIRLGFQYSNIMKTQCVAFDFIQDQNQQPILIEVSYGFSVEVYDPCEGYWDSDLTWHPGEFNPQGWMVDLVLKGLNS